MDKQTITQYGMIVVATIILVTIMVLATPFGNNITNAITEIRDKQATKSEEMLSKDAMKNNSDEMYELFDISDKLEPGLYNTGQPTVKLTDKEMIEQNFISIDSYNRLDTVIAPPNIKGDFIIPEKVMLIKAHAFRYSGLTLVRLNAETGVIGEFTFDDSSSLKTFIAGSKLRILQRNAFSNCASLKTVYLNNNLERVEGKTFANCPLLKTINYDGTMNEWKSISFATNWCDDTLEKIVCSDGTIEL